jgi:CRP-like cAMP-binding protein
MLPSAQQCLGAFAAQLRRHTALTDADADLIHSLPARITIAEAHQDYRSTTSIWIVAQGTVGRFAESLDGGRQITGLYCAGDVFGLSAIMMPDGTQAYEVIERSWLCVLPVSALVQVLACSTRVMEALWRQTCIDAARTDKWLLNVGRRDARGRVAHLLCELACRTWVKEGVRLTSFRVSLTQLQMADATGITPVYVNRILMSFRQEQIISLHGGWAQVEDWDRLADIAEFDESYLCLNSSPGELSAKFNF